MYLVEVGTQGVDPRAPKGGIEKRSHMVPHEQEFQGDLSDLSDQWNLYGSRNGPNLTMLINTYIRFTARVSAFRHIQHNTFRVF
jgi:hypothetical protein